MSSSDEEIVATNEESFKFCQVYIFVLKSKSVK